MLANFLQLNIEYRVSSTPRGERRVVDSIWGVVLEIRVRASYPPVHVRLNSPYLAKRRRWLNYMLNVMGALKGCRYHPFILVIILRYE